MAWRAISALCVGFFMILLDTTIVNVAIPSMISDLPASLNDVIWVNSVYLLAFAVPLLLTGRLGDRYGPRRVYLTGLVVFVGASLWCGLSASVELLITARAVQGLGAAAMMPQTMAFITHLFPPARRGAAMGMWGSVAGFATVSGPLMGGLLVERLGWEWIFFVNVPVGVLALVLALLWVPDWQPKQSRRFDVRGILLCCLGLGLLVFGVQNGEHYRWGRVFGPVTIFEMIIAGVVLLAAFVLWQASSRNPEPLMPLRVFRNRNFSLGNVANLVIGFTVTGMFVPIVLYLQNVLLLSPLASGLMTAPTSLASGVVAFFAGRLSNRSGGKYLPAVGFGLLAAGIGVLVFLIEPGTHPGVLLPALICSGVGMGMVYAPLANITTRGVDPRLMGSGAGIFNTSRQFGNVLGSAGVGAVLQVRVAATGDLSAATADALLVLVGGLVLGVIAALLMRRESGLTDFGRASRPGLPVTRPS